MKKTLFFWVILDFPWVGPSRTPSPVFKNKPAPIQNSAELRQIRSLPWGHDFGRQKKQSTPPLGGLIPGSKKYYQGGTIIRMGDPPSALFALARSPAQAPPAGASGGCLKNGAADPLTMRRTEDDGKIASRACPPSFVERLPPPLVNANLPIEKFPANLVLVRTKAETSADRTLKTRTGHSYFGRLRRGMVRCWICVKLCPVSFLSHLFIFSTNATS